MKSNTRCQWAEKDDLYRAYHDKEWGKPIFDEAVFFEFIILETFQAGLSWHTILIKRENFRKAFDNFDYKKIAKYDLDKTTELLNNAGIIRHKLKVASAVTNAIAFMAIQKEFGSFSTYFWTFTEGKQIWNSIETLSDVPATTALSDKISKDLKKRGFKFVGSTTIYAFMQAVGMVDDHLNSCFCKSENKNNYN